MMRIVSKLFVSLFLCLGACFGANYFIALMNMANTVAVLGGLAFLIALSVGVFTLLYRIWKGEFKENNESEN